MPLLAHMRENRKRPREDGGAGHAINGSIEQQTEEQKKHSVLLAKIKEIRKRPQKEQCEQQPVQRNESKEQRKQQPVQGNESEEQIKQQHVKHDENDEQSKEGGRPPQHP